MAQALANLRQAELNLEYATVRAPVGGRVSKKTVEVGQVVQAGQPLLALVDLDDVWIVANFKETALTHVRPGQRAIIEVDTYPGAAFKARVDSIQAGSGAVFSLLPARECYGEFRQGGPARPGQADVSSRARIHAISWSPACRSSPPSNSSNIRRFTPKHSHSSHIGAELRAKPSWGA